MDGLLEVALGQLELHPSLTAFAAAVRSGVLDELVFESSTILCRAHVLLRQLGGVEQDVVVDLIPAESLTVPVDRGEPGAVDVRGEAECVGEMGSGTAAVGVHDDAVDQAPSTTGRPRVLTGFARRAALCVEVGDGRVVVSGTVGLRGETARVSSKLALAREQTVGFQYAEACRLMVKAVAEQRARMPPAHPELAVMLHELGAVHYALGQYQAGAEAYAEAVKIDEGNEVLAEQLASGWYNLGTCYSQLTLATPAIPAYRRALELFGQTESLATRSCWYNLGSALVLTGDCPGALEAFQRALDIERDLWGPDHPQSVVTLQTVANVYMRMGYNTEAQQIWDRVIAARGKQTTPAPSSDILRRVLEGIRKAEEDERICITTTVEEGWRDYVPFVIERREEVKKERLPDNDPLKGLRVEDQTASRFLHAKKRAPGSG
mmetsp:Transcript_56738/g.151359  ORF Transcript_56738/g.151359 Transcript_56738/m.151359 type:complete len:435 (+) Transcript_56738:25-1329(+)